MDSNGNAYYCLRSLTPGWAQFNIYTMKQYHQDPSRTMEVNVKNIFTYWWSKTKADDDAGAGRIYVVSSKYLEIRTEKKTSVSSNRTGRDCYIVLTSEIFLFVYLIEFPRRTDQIFYLLKNSTWYFLTIAFSPEVQM
jgi:hypothetical protein